MGSFVECLGDIVEIASVETSNTDSTVHCHVDVALFSELVDLISVKASVSEHTYLTCNVAPVMNTAILLQFINETLSHRVHS